MRWFQGSGAAPAIIHSPFKIADEDDVFVYLHYHQASAARRMRETLGLNHAGRISFIGPKYSDAGSLAYIAIVRELQQPS